MVVLAGMAELADAADLKSAGLKKLVGVRVPLSAPANRAQPLLTDPISLLGSAAMAFAIKSPISVVRSMSPARKEIRPCLAGLNPVS